MRQAEPWLCLPLDTERGSGSYEKDSLFVIVTMEKKTKAGFMHI
jgi:hypothetical protein